MLYYYFIKIFLLVKYFFIKKFYLKNCILSIQYDISYFYDITFTFLQYQLQYLSMLI